MLDECMEESRLRLSAEMALVERPQTEPVNCDRWLARSLLHKAIRRGEVHLALRSLATLVVEGVDRVWRALAIIAMEDVGIASFHVLTNIVAAGQDRRWRRKAGGDWAIASLLVLQMCEAQRDQAACDMHDHALYDPELEAWRDRALEADREHLAELLQNADTPLLQRAVCALALGGGLADGQRLGDPAAVFDLLSDAGCSRDAVEVCRAAWRLTRVSLAFMLPLLAEPWTRNRSIQIVDDPLPSVELFGDIPDFAMDQFTRSGIQVARRMLVADADLRSILDAAGIPRATQHRTVGDLIFLVEGGLLTRRVRWDVGDALRLPQRCLADTTKLGSTLPTAITHIAAKRPLMTALRRQLLPPPSMVQSCLSFTG